MPDKDQIANLIARERQSRQLAQEAGDVAMRKAHEDMAANYAAQIQATLRDSPA